MSSNGNCLAWFCLLFIPLCAWAHFPASISPLGEKQIIVDPKIHMWAAYDEDGKLVKSGIATAGSDYCRDLGRPCRTKVGHFRIDSLGEANCRSRTFPLYRGGAPMPYCMYFANGMALHGSNEVVRGNRSHGCVRMHKEDAKWIRYHFAEEPTPNNEGLGTIVVIKHY